MNLRKLHDEKVGYKERMGACKRAQEKKPKAISAKRSYWDRDVAPAKRSFSSSTTPSLAIRCALSAEPDQYAPPPSPAA
jgi:hypothetical protein